MSAPLEKAEGTEFSVAIKQVEDEKKKKLKGAVFLGCVSGFFILCGFGSAVALAKRKDPKYFAKGLSGTKEVPESGADLAIRALGWATLYSFGGFSLFCYGVWKMLGVSNLSEFHEKMQKLIPRRPQPEPKGRTEFEGFRDLFTYLENLDRKRKTFSSSTKE